MDDASNAGRTGPGPNPAERARAIAETLIGSFTDRLVSEARGLGGFLTIADLERLSEELHAKAGALQRVFEQGFEEYVRARERAAQGQGRRYPFDRIVVNRFAHLFALGGAYDPDRVTRKVLPAFFMALDKMLGEEAAETFQAKTRAIVERLSPRREGEPDWDALYADAEARELARDALLAMAPYFEDFAKRRDWFVALVNGHLGAPAAADPDPDWVLSPGGFELLADELFGDLRAALADAEARARLTRRHGGIAVFEAGRALERADRARAEEKAAKRRADEDAAAAARSEPEGAGADDENTATGGT
jgi:hypothetical protein